MYEKTGYCAALLTIAYLTGQDIKRKEISLCALIISGCVAILYLAAGDILKMEQVSMSILPGVVLLMLSFLSGEKIGCGDGVATLVLGLWTGGMFCMLAVGIGILFTGCYAVFVLLFKRGEKQIPFMPFLLCSMEVLFFCV